MKQYFSRAVSALIGGFIFFGISYFYHHHMTDYSTLERTGIDTTQELVDMCKSDDRLKKDGCFIFIRATLKTTYDIFDAYKDIKHKCDIDTITVASLSDYIVRWAKDNPNAAKSNSSDSVIISMLRDSPTCGRADDF